MLRRAFVVVCLAAVTTGVSACARRGAQQAVDARVAAASELAAARLSEWLGPGRSPVTARPDASLFDPRGAMTIESRVAYEYGRERFRHLVADETFIGDGIAWYLQSRIVADAFNAAFGRPGYRHHTACFFGCRVRWSIDALITSRWNDGVGRTPFLRDESGRAWPALEAPVPLDARAIRIALLLASLERELGWSTLQGALRAAATARGDRSFAEIVERATARDLSGAFAIALASPAADYRVADFRTAPASCGSQPCHLTRIVLSRTGDVPFPLPLIVEFGDDARAIEQWRGEETVEFESAAPATTAQLDSDRHWLLDVDYTNNRRASAQQSAGSVVKWIAYWATWLQDAMLVYTFPI